MSWLRIDDGFCDHPKIGTLSDRVFRAHLRALCYAARFSPGVGFLSARAIKVLGIAPAVVRELTDAGLWDEVEDGFTIHDFPTYNPRADAQAKADAGRRGGIASGEARRKQNEAECLKQNEAECLDLLEAKRSSRADPVPVPSRPVLKSSSSSFGISEDGGGEQEIPQPVREMRDAVLAKLPAKFRNDSEQWDAAESFARDFAGMWTELQAATDAVRRQPNRQPFPGNLREFMPKPTTGPPGSPETFGLRSVDELFPPRPKRGTPEWDAYVLQLAEAEKQPQVEPDTGPWVVVR